MKKVLRVSHVSLFNRRDIGCVHEPGNDRLFLPSMSATSLRNICASLRSALIPGTSGTGECEVIVM